MGSLWQMLGLKVWLLVDSTSTPLRHSSHFSKCEALGGGGGGGAKGGGGRAFHTENCRFWGTLPTPPGLLIWALCSRASLLLSRGCPSISLSSAGFSPCLLFPFSSRKQFGCVLVFCGFLPLVGLLLNVLLLIALVIFYKGATTKAASKLSRFSGAVGPQETNTFVCWLKGNARESKK